MATSTKKFTLEVQVEDDLIEDALEGSLSNPTLFIRQRIWEALKDGFIDRGRGIDDVTIHEAPDPRPSVKTEGGDWLTKAMKTLDGYDLMRLNLGERERDDMLREAMQYLIRHLTATYAPRPSEESEGPYDGQWKCKCGCCNHSLRNTCRDCHKPRPVTHILHKDGRSLCGFSLHGPDTWPKGHLWVLKEDVETTPGIGERCPECVALQNGEAPSIPLQPSDKVVATVQEPGPYMVHGKVVELNEGDTIEVQYTNAQDHIETAARVALVKLIDCALQAAPLERNVNGLYILATRWMSSPKERACMELDVRIGDSEATFEVIIKEKGR
jgi:hypothetical protein